MNEFLEIAKEMLGNIDVDLTDPQKEIVEKAYKECLARARAAGKSEEEIQKETEEAVQI